ncbi:MAG: hypothetical protein JO156_05565 [Solirubrobacterales bacterium]|nr:hypothetical protein [Solirubrobacterales bacterium]
MTDTSAPPGLTIAGELGQHVAADRVVDEIDLTDGGLPPGSLDVDEVLGAELEHALARAGPTGSDHVSPGPARELHPDRPDPAAGAMDHHGLAGLEVAVIEQRLPGGPGRTRGAV